MPDSFSELRTAGGPNRPWIAAGVGALAVSLILIALAAAWWYAQPQPEADTIPATVTVTAQPGPAAQDLAPAGTYSGMLNSLNPDARTPSWPAVAVFGGGTGSVTYPDTGCTTLIDENFTNTPLTEACNTTPGATGEWRVDASEPGLVHLTYLEGDTALVEGTLSAGMYVTRRQG